MSGGGGELARESARRALRLAVRAYIAFAAISGAVLSLVYLSGVREISIDDRTRRVVQILLIISFFAATIINLGLQWAARILGARRYRRNDPRPAARVIAASQVAAFVVYSGVVGLVVYYRVAVGGGAEAMIPAVAAVLAGFYFLRLPRYMIAGAYRSEGRGESDRRGK